MFHNPVIPPNTGNAIRMSAITGIALHLVEPLGFELTDARLRRAGLDYHDLSRVFVHSNFDTAVDFVTKHGTGNIYAFTGHASTQFNTVEYLAGDTLLFGTEPTGLPDDVLNDGRLKDKVRIPMLPGVRSINLSNSASIATFEAWRQHDYATPPATWLPHHPTSLAVQELGKSQPEA
ncbi:MAG TPA: tRNA (cytidine(34)-2'-O)-methyltransferase [Beutenbergiaceae bacterium]|nr:tRNA (cytidine(34)-2'-O)-methyltransferase [Beutenbergiaceae bacterium]